MKHGKNFFVGGIMNLAAGLGAAGYGAYQERQAKKKMAQADELAAGPIRSQAARQRIARQTSDAQAGVDAALRAQATAAQQLGEQGGSRALVSATPGLVRATELASQRAIASVPTADESVLTAGQNQQARANLNRLSRAADAARQTTIGGISTALMGAAEIAGGIDWEGRKENRTTKRAEKAADRAATAAIPKTDAMQAMTQQAMRETQQGILGSTKRPALNIVDEDVLGGSGTQIDPMAGRLTPSQIASSGFGKYTNTTYGPTYGATPGETIDRLADRARTLGKQNETSRVLYEMGKLDAQTPKIQQQEEELNALLNQPMSEGGELDREVEKTPGEFDHDDNPIDIVQEGAKIGEMTGGEYIFNPEQAEEMRKLSKEGDTELHEFVRNLLNKEQFK